MHFFELKKMRVVFTCLLLIGIASISYSQMDRLYLIDNSHSIIDFKASHKGFGAVRGTFEQYNGTIYFDESNIEKTRATIVIEASSLSTRNEGRDGILTGKFFETNKFPSISFQSKKVVKKGEDYAIEGELKIRDKVQIIQIPFEVSTMPTTDQFNHKRIAFTGQFKVNRKDFELFYRGNEFWDSIVSDEIKLDFEIGAYVYDAIETIFPIRDKHISTRIMAIWEKDGLEAAKTSGKDILKSEPQNWNTSIARMWRMALKLAQSGELEKAITFCDLTIELYQDIEEAESISDMQVYKGIFQMEMGKKKEGKESIKKALEMYPMNSMAIELLR